MPRLRDGRYWCVASAAAVLLWNGVEPALPQCGELPQIVPTFYSVVNDPNDPNGMQQAIDEYVEAIGYWYDLGIKDVCFIFQEPPPSIHDALMDALEAANMADVQVIPGRKTAEIFLSNQGQFVCGWTDADHWQLLADDMEDWLSETNEASRFLLDVEFVYHGSAQYGCTDTRYHWRWCEAEEQWYPPQCPFDPNDPNGPGSTAAMAEWMSDFGDAIRIPGVADDLEVWWYPGVYADDPNEWHVRYNRNLSWATARVLHNTLIGMGQPDCRVVDLSYGGPDWNVPGAWNMRLSVARVFDPNVPDDPNQTDPNNADLSLARIAPIVWFRDPDDPNNGPMRFYWPCDDARRPLDLMSTMPGDHTYAIYFIDASTGWAATSASVTSALLHCKGDMDCDSDVDYDDINLFVEAHTKGQAAWESAHPHCSWFNGDFNGDGDVGFSDIPPFVAAIPSTCTWPP